MAGCTSVCERHDDVADVVDVEYDHDDDDDDIEHSVRR